MGYLANLKSTIESYPNHSGFLIAYSGGADSTALLHLCAHYKNVRAIHINHGIQIDADEWQQHCQQTCEKLDIKLIVEQAHLSETSENACRNARYDFFSQHLRQDEILLTAHHSQDQAETILLKLLRGTGIKGLCGIERIRAFAQGFIARPLLHISPQTLKDYLISNGINWIEDNSNNDDSYKRNYIRHQIIPSLQSQFPQAIDNITRSAENTSKSLALLNHLIDFTSTQLEISHLKKLPKNLQTTLLYHWLANKNLPTPDKPALEQITHDFITAKVDKHPHYQNNYYQLMRHQKAIYCIKNYETTPVNKEYSWHTNTLFTLPNNCGTIEYSRNKHLQLIIKFNQKGQKLKTHKHQFNKTIKQLFQDYNIPIWQRQNTPFIYHNGVLVSLGYNWSHTLELKNAIQYSLFQYDN